MPSIGQAGGNLAEKQNAANLKLAQLRQPRPETPRPSQANSNTFVRGTRNSLLLNQNRRLADGKPLEQRLREEGGKKAGAWAGGALGAVILPVVGGAIGAFIGRLVGKKAGGSVMGKWLLFGTIAATVLFFLFLLALIALVVVVIIPALNSPWETFQL